MQKYIVKSRCVAEGTVLEVGDIVELDDRIADKLLHLSPPRIAPHVAVDAPKRKATKKHDRMVRDVEAR